MIIIIFYFLIAVFSISIIIYIFPPVTSEIEYSDVLLFFRVFFTVLILIIGVFVIWCYGTVRNGITECLHKSFMKVFNIRNLIPNNPRKLFIGIIIIIGMLLCIFRWNYKYTCAQKNTKYSDVFSELADDVILKQFEEDHILQGRFLALSDKDKKKAKLSMYKGLSENPDFMKRVSEEEEKRKPYLSKVIDDLGNIPGAWRAGNLYWTTELSILILILIIGIFVVLYCITIIDKIVEYLHKSFLKVFNIRNRIFKNPRKLFIGISVFIIVAALLYIFRWEYSYTTGNRPVMQLRRNIYTGTTQYRFLPDGDWKIAGKKD